MASDVRLVDLVEIIRSKNAGPFRFTLDILFTTRSTFDATRRSKVLSAERVAALYGIPLSDITDYVEYEPAKAIKITLRRPHSAGSPNDTDVYGCQQHGPLLSVTVPLEEQE